MDLFISPVRPIVKKIVGRNRDRAGRKLRKRRAAQREIEAGKAGEGG
jgi:hypothetical protein